MSEALAKAEIPAPAPREDGPHKDGPEERLARWTAAYAALPGLPDELLAPDGSMRPAWHRFLCHLAGLTDAEIAARLAAAGRHIHETGIAYRAYGEATERDWPIGALPLLVEGAEWQAIAAGVAQRAELLEAVLTDLYGDGALARSGLLPAAAAAGDPEFLRPLVGVTPPGGRHLHFYADDLARGPRGAGRRRRLRRGRRAGPRSPGRCRSRTSHGSGW